MWSAGGIESAVNSVNTVMINFLEPQRLWWLSLVGLLLLWYLAMVIRAGKGTGLKSELQRYLPQRARWKQHLSVFFALFSVAILIVAYATPSEPTKIPRERATVVLAIDVSKSMECEDVSPTRIAAAKTEAKKFVRELPRGFNVSLVSFAGTATLLVPPTTDRDVLENAIENLELAPATAIGDAVYTSLKAGSLAPPDSNDPDKKAPTVVVLLSDGKTTLGRNSATAAEEAKKMNVPIYTIAYGTPNGTIPVEGGLQRVPVDYAELKRVSSISGGEAYRAESASELKTVYEGLSKELGYDLKAEPVAYKYAGYAWIFGLLALLGIGSLALRWP